MGDTVAGSALVTPVSFGSSTQTVTIAFDRIRIHTIMWDYVANTLYVYVDYGREDPLDPPNSEWFTKPEPHPIVNLTAGDSVNINGIAFTRLAGTHLTTLNALVVTGGLVVKENLEDAIFAAFVAMNYFPLGVET